ncbi:ECF transporter S component [Bacillota bacterium LX-D]|nr:ECF transporter S component [Bacillota bacterium LX-D]
MNKTTKFSLKDIVIVGLLAAICTIGTMIKIPYGNGAMVHLGTAALFASAILFGGVRAGLAGAIASAFVDLFSGFFLYTVWSLVIKGIAGLIVGSIAHSGGSKGNSVVRNILGCILGAVWTLAGYLVAWTAVIGRFEAAIANVPSSLITSSVGILIAIPLSATLRIALSKSGILDRS